MMYRFFIKHGGCNGCGRCDEVLPGFYSDSGGSILISQTNLVRTEVFRKLLDAINTCPVGALGLEQVYTQAGAAAKRGQAGC